MASELEKLKAQVTSLQKRVSALEGSSDEQTPQPIQEEPQVQEKIVSKDTNSNTLGIVGGVVLSLGFIFLIAYAIDQGWISRAMQIVFGILLGAGITVGGYFLHKKMDLQGSILCAVGIITAYFSIYSGYVFEAYRAATGFSLGIATLLLVLVLLVASYLAYKQDSPILLIEALALSFIATFMESYQWLSLIYTSLFVAGFCALCYLKKWRYPAIIGGSITAFLTLINLFRADLAQSFAMIAVFGILFLLLSLQRSNAPAAVATIVVSYFLFLLPLESSQFAITTLLAGALCLMLYAFSAAQKQAHSIYLLAGIGFIMFWIPQQFDGYFVVNSWILIAGLLAYAHTQNSENWLLSSSVVTAILAAGAINVQLATDYQQIATILTLLFASVTCFIVSYSYALSNKYEAHPYYIAGVASLLLLVALELSKFWITLSFAFIAFLSLMLGLQTARPVPKQVGLGILALAVGKLFIIDTISLSAGLRIVAYITLGIVLLVGSVLYRKYVQD